MTDLTPERRAELRGLAESAQPFIRHGGTDPAAVYVPATDLTALLDAADERDRLRAAVRQIADACHWSHDPSGDPEALIAHIGQLQQIAEDACDERDRLAASPRDEYHTMEELYEYRMLYNALAANAMPERAVKSWRHSDGEECFGGGWFVVYLDLPTGQVSNHYEAFDWDLFRVPEVDFAPEWDGHTPADAADRIRRALDGAEEAHAYLPVTEDADGLTCDICGAELADWAAADEHMTQHEGWEG